jgi:hypothetical protein
MAKKTKELAKCNGCGLSDPLYITLEDGGRLPSYAINMADYAIYCFPCNDKRKNGN